MHIITTFSVIASHEDGYDYFYNYWATYRYLYVLENACCPKRRLQKNRQKNK